MPNSAVDDSRKDVPPAIPSRPEHTKSKVSLCSLLSISVSGGGGLILNRRYFDDCPFQLIVRNQMKSIYQVSKSKMI